MDNEEPIELAHYPGAHFPEPNAVAPIDREDFPAPPYPYAVEGNNQLEILLLKPLRTYLYFDFRSFY